MDREFYKFCKSLDGVYLVTPAKPHNSRHTVNNPTHFDEVIAETKTIIKDIKADKYDVQVVLDACAHVFKQATTLDNSDFKQIDKTKEYIKCLKIVDNIFNKCTNSITYSIEDLVNKYETKKTESYNKLNKLSKEELIALLMKDK